MAKNVSGWWKKYFKYLLTFINLESRGEAVPEDLEAGSAITDSQAAEAVKQLNGGSTLE